MTAIAMIPAKAESFRVPGKNLRRLGELRLVAWTIRAAQEAERIDRVIVITDCQRIANIATLGMAESMARPERLSLPDATATDVTIWAVNELGLEGDETAIVQLLPTSPFRAADHVDEALDLWEKDPRASVVSVRRVSNKALRYETAQGWLSSLRAPGYTDYHKSVEPHPNTFVSTGGIQIASAATLRAFGRFHIPKTRPIVLNSIAGLDIDTEADWALAEGIAR